MLGAARCPPPERHEACAVGGGSRPRVSWTPLWGGGRGLLAFLSVARISPLRLPQWEVTAWEPSQGLGPRASRLPASPRWLWGPPSSSRPPAVRPPSSLVSQAPPPRRGPPQLHGGTFRALRPQSRGNLSADPTDDRAAGNGRGFLASSVAETPGRQ